MENLREDTILRLVDLGYTATVDDEFNIDFTIQKIVNLVKSTCNISVVPEALREKIVDRVASEVIYVIKNAGKLPATFDFDSVAQIVKEGDASITFAYGEGCKTPEQRFDNLLDQMKKNFFQHITAYRRISW
jgi:hypothetical protein